MGSLKVTGEKLSHRRVFVYPIDFSFNEQEKWYYKSTEKFTHNFTVKYDKEGGQLQLAIDCTEERLAQGAVQHETVIVRMLWNTSETKQTCGHCIYNQETFINHMYSKHWAL